MKPIYLILSKPFGEIAECGSCFWGDPDLPEDVNYPMYIDNEGERYPFTFICQINLEELASFAPSNPLPKKGLLSFFAKIDHYLGYMADTDCIGGHISEADEVRVMYFPSCEGMRKVVLVDDDDEPLSPEAMEIRFADSIGPLSDDHALFAEPTHREWETWDEPFEDWQILLQVDSFAGMDFELNFMDCGVLDFLISPEALRNADFSDVRGIVLST